MKMKKRICSWLVIGFMTGLTVLTCVAPLGKEPSVVVTDDAKDKPVHPLAFSNPYEKKDMVLEKNKSIEVEKETVVAASSLSTTSEPTPNVTEEPVKQEEVKMETTTTPVVTEAPISVETEQPVEVDISISEEDVRLIALLTMAEAEGESEYGKRLVIDTILNRVDSEYFPNTVYGVVYQEGQFTSMWNGRADSCYVDEYICQLVREEMASRTNYDVLYFRAGYYFSFGTPVVNEGNHYFSTY